MKRSVTSREKEIIQLTDSVATQQPQVDVQQAIVTSLTDKLAYLQQQLAIAESNRTAALKNVQSKDALVQQAKDLVANARIASDQCIIADTKAKELSAKLTNMVNKLVYTVEILNKLSNLVIRKKALNPLISDELVSMLANAGNEANNAIAVSLVALKGVFSATATSNASLAVLQMANIQAVNFSNSLNGIAAAAEPLALPSTLNQLIDDACQEADRYYHYINEAVMQLTQHLNNATSILDQKQVELSSSQAAMMAAIAAASV